MKLAYGIVIVVLALAAGTFFFYVPRSLPIGPASGANTSSAVAVGNTTSSVAQAATSAPSVALPSESILLGTNDAPPQQPLANPPAIVKGIYLTGWSAGSPAKVQSIINMIKGTEINTVVVDIKDYSGYVSYAMDVPEVRASGAEGEIRITRPNAMLKAFHDNGIYVIGRITDFQDPILAKAHPEWALKNKVTGAVWKDNAGLAWMDPAAPPVWDYLASIAKDGFARGFDEIQFDYIRFASDGAIGSISYPYWDMKTSRASVIASYFKFLRQTFPNNKISADLFGLATVNSDDLGIGQVIQNAYKYFDYVSPMVYPSHYATGFMGYKSPASYPYEVINYSMTHAIEKLVAMGNSNSTVSTAGTATSTPSSTKPLAYSPFDLGYVPNSKLRPWLQDFDLLGVPYTPKMVEEEKQAVYDTIDTPNTSQYYGGSLLWNAANVYTAATFARE